MRWSVGGICVLLLWALCAMRSAAQTPGEDAAKGLPDAPSAAAGSVGSARPPGSDAAIMPAAIAPISPGARHEAAGNRSMWNPVTLVDRLAGDQKEIWTSPLRLRRSDAMWALPSLAVTGAFTASDSWFAKQVPEHWVSRSRSLSNYGAFSLAGTGAGMFFLGKLMHNDHASETGFLAGESAVNATLVDLALKSVFQRQRPFQGTGAGNFFAGGSSFPSEHAAASWAIAGVLAHEYPGPFTKLFAYGMASAVTVSRVTGREHFPTDVIVGGALGYFVARQIYLHRRDPEVSEAAWASPVERHTKDKERDPANMGSSYVPVDSWVYPLIERLIAMGYVQSAYVGQRPWTRMQCARFLEEADEKLRYSEGDERTFDDAEAEQATKILATLESEFVTERRRLDGAPNLGMTLDSMYVRSTNISGRPLTDGYHFAQTIIDDYGRPYGEGVSGISGFMSHGEAGPFSYEVQGEFQHAPSIPAYSTSVQQAIALADFSAPLSNATGTINRFRLMSSTVAFTFKNLQFSVGRQTEWWGPSDSAPFLASNNAAPINMVQLQNVVPFHIPLLSALFGPAQSVFFVGELSGQAFDLNGTTLVGPGFHPQPFIHGNKVSFKPTANLEFGMGVTAIFGGPGLPFTFGEFLKSYYSHRASNALNPAKRFSGFDFSYRIPHLRKWLTFYNDSMTGDEVSPIGSSRPLLNPGLYLPQVPKIPKLELRFEGDKEPFSGVTPGFLYFDRRYVSGYTNQGNLIGSWIGRDGFGAQAWATYWFSPRTKLQASYRYQEMDRKFLEGGRLTDYSLRADTTLDRELQISTVLQYEQWMFPMLAATRQSNVSAQVQLTFYPHIHTRN